MHVFFSVGEPSGDQHAAELMREFLRRQPGTRLSGFGGPEMQAEKGFECLYQLTDLAVMGFAEVLPMIGKFVKLYRQAKEFLKREKPDAVVLVDFPGFNWWIAKAAKQAGIPVYYYCPPQLWAWAPWRIHKVRRLVDCILSVLPFEAQWYRERSVEVEYVGHPFFDEVAEHPISPATLAEFQIEGCQTIGILPGSRKQEVMKNYRVMLDMMDSLYENHPNIQFQVACYKQWHFDECTKLFEEHGNQLPIEFHIGKTSEIIEAADMCLMVSGSVSLEMLARKTPAVVMFRLDFISRMFARFFITSKYISLPNLIADELIIPEFTYMRAKSRKLERYTAQLDEWLADRESLQATQAKMSQLADEIVETGGVKRAAEVLVKRLTQERTESQTITKRAA